MDIKDHQEEIDFQRYWFVVKRRWLPASLIFVSVVTLATFYALTRKPSYEAEAKLLFQTSRAPSLTGLLREGYGSSGAENLGRLEGLVRENNPLDTQAEIVSSVPIAQATIEALDLKDGKGNKLEPEALLKQFKVKAIPGTDILRISYQSGDPKQAAAVVNQLVDVFVQNNIQSNRAEPIAAREFIAAQLPKTELAVQEADQALRKFKEENGILVLKEEASAAVTTIATLNDQIAQITAQLADVTAQSRKLQSQIQTNPQKAILYATLSQSPGVQDVLTQLQQAQRELVVQQTRYVSGPPITKLEEKVAALDVLLKDRVKQIAGSEQQFSTGNLQVGDTGKELVVKLAEIEAQRTGLAERLNVLSSSFIAYRERARSIPALEKRQRELERKLEAAQTTYEALLARLQAIQVAENQNIGNTRIVARATVPKSAIASKKSLILGGAAVGGLLLAIASAFALDLIDRSVKTVKEAKDLFGLPLLGVIPAFRRNTKVTLNPGRLEYPTPKVVTRDIPRSAISEAYQMLQANLRFLSSDKAIKTIVISSAVPKEGKSEISANLAAAIAQIGRKTLLIDADMRRPSQHHIWDVTNMKGLSNIMVEQVDLKSALHEIMPNLHLLTSGSLPPNPMALLDSKRMAAMVTEFSEIYDFVIFDTPPIAGTADACVLGKITDGILLVVRPGVVDSSSANAAKDLLIQTGQNVLGVVINGIDAKNEPDSYFYYNREPDVETQATMALFKDLN